MVFDKRKYSRDEVIEITDEITREYEEKLAEQKERISELVRENAKFSAELAEYKGRDKQISDALKNAEIYSAEQKRKSNEQYVLTKTYLTEFISKWKKYFDMLVEKYPMYPIVVSADKMRERVEEILKNGEDAVKKIIGEFYESTGDALDGFDPKKKISEYIAATDDSGFSMDEVLNPGKLQLEDLCKELGLLAESDL
ncbi:MAG: hypothetical protein IJQ66_07100 [Clostridia bacterium]|nr:hypothetical protein [Clostridia bacterium]